MSDSKSSSSSSSSAAAGGMKPIIALMGDRAQTFVFSQLQFVGNKPKHRIWDGKGSTEKGKEAMAVADAWRSEASEQGKKTVFSGAGPLGMFLGACYLSLTKPPVAGNCGEMALLAYRKIITLGIQYGCSMGVAAVSIADGNHSFVLAGSDPGFMAAIKGEPRTLACTTDRLPTEWGNVYVCDPWIDDGHCPTFLAVGRNKKYETPWELFLRRVGAQADKTVQKALGALSGSAPLLLRVDDCVVIVSTFVPAGGSAAAGSGGEGKA